MTRTIRKERSMVRCNVSRFKNKKLKRRKLNKKKISKEHKGKDCHTCW